MKNYRIKKETTSYGSYRYDKYYPQVKVLWWWHNLFSFNDYYIGFPSLEKAQEALCSHIKKSVVEYIDFDYERDCK